MFSIRTLPFHVPAAQNGKAPFAFHSSAPGKPRTFRDIQGTIGLPHRPPVFANCRSALNRSLAVLMTILLSPIVAPVSGNRQDFQAVAQITIVTCDGAGSTAIIKKPCG